MNVGLRGVAGAVRLRGPLANEPKAGALHTILLAMVAWLSFHLLIVVPWFAARKPQQVMLVGSLVVLAGIALYFLQRGSLRIAAVVYVVGCWAVFTIIIFLFGGIRSPALILYTALPIYAALPEAKVERRPCATRSSSRVSARSSARVEERAPLLPSLHPRPSARPLVTRSPRRSTTAD